MAERRAAEPVLPLGLFRNRVFASTSAVGFIVGLALFGSITYLPLYLQIVKGASRDRVGLQLLPLMAGVLIASIGSGQLITRTGRYKVFPIVGTALMVVGMLLLVAARASTRRSRVADVYMLVLGLGLGFVMQVLVLAVQNAVDYANLGVATSRRDALPLDGRRDRRADLRRDLRQPARLGAARAGCRRSSPAQLPPHLGPSRHRRAARLRCASRSSTPTPRRCDRCS